MAIRSVRATVEKLLAKVPVKGTILLEGSPDSAMLPLAFAQQISLKEEQYRSRLNTGGVVTALGAGMATFGAAVWMLNNASCDGINLEIDFGLSGTEGETPQQMAERERRKAEEARMRDQKAKACRERSIGRPLTAVGAGVLMVGVATLTSAASLSEELRELKRQAQGFGVSLAPLWDSLVRTAGMSARLEF